MRAKWKGSYNFGLMSGSKVWDRSIMIISEDIGKIVEVYNGFKFFEVIIDETMVGKKLGEFVLTKKIGASIHAKKKNKSKR